MPTALVSPQRQRLGTPSSTPETSPRLSVRRAGKQKAASRELSTHPPAITSESFIKLYGNRHNPVNFNNLEDFQTRRGELSRGREMTSAPRKRTKRAWQKEQPCTMLFTRCFCLKRNALALRLSLTHVRRTLAVSQANLRLVEGSSVTRPRRWTPPCLRSNAPSARARSCGSARIRRRWR